MSILSTFVYLFEGDTKPLEQAQAGAERDTKRLRGELDKTDETAARLGQSFLGFARAAGAGIAAALSAGAILAMVRDVTSANDALGDNAAAIGVSVEALSLWDSAAEMSGGQAGAFTASLGAFNERMQEAARVGKGPVNDMLASLGVSLADLKKNADDPIAVLTDMSDKLSELSAAEAAGIGKKLGLDPGTINLLREGRVGLEELLDAQRELGFVTAADASTSAAYNDALDRMNKMWEQVRRRIVLFVVPALTWLADKWGAVAKFIDENSTIIAIGMGVIALALTGVLLPALASTAVAAWALIAPFLPIAAVILGVGAAIALVAEDLYRFQTGSDSLIGELAEKWPIVGDVIKATGDVAVVALETLFASADALLTLLGGDRAGAVEGFGKRIQALADDIESRYPAFEGLGDIVRDNVDFFTEANAGLDELLQSFFAIMHGRADLVSDKLDKLGVVFRVMAGLVRNGINTITGVWEALVTVIERATEAAREFRAQGAPTPAVLPLPLRAALTGARSLLGQATSSNVGAVSSGATLAGATNNRNTSVSVGTVEVNTQATDAEGIAAGIGSALDQQLRSAADQADDGVLA